MPTVAVWRKITDKPKHFGKKYWRSLIRRIMPKLKQMPA